MKRLLVQLSICFVCAATTLYTYLTEQNRFTQIKMRLPKVAKEIVSLRQEISELHYQIVCFESPDHLLQLAQAPKYAHLKFPLLQDLQKLPQGLALQWPSADQVFSQSKPAALLGAKKVPLPKS